MLVSGSMRTLTLITFLFMGIVYYRRRGKIKKNTKGTGSVFAIRLWPHSSVIKKQLCYPKGERPI
jgi:hypothetical protein